MPNKQRKSIIVTVLLGLFTIIFLTAGTDACGNPIPGSNNVTSSTSSTSSGLTEADCSSLQFKLACLSIIKRYNYLADPNKYGYFYEFNPGSSVPILEEVVQGSVFPTSDLVNPENWQQACVNSNGTSCAVVLEKQQPDGTYGTNGTGVFGWGADGNYFEWNGTYHYDQAPVKYPTINQIAVAGCEDGVPGC